MKDVSEQMFLSVVGGENGDFFGGVTESAHVHESGNNEFRLGQVLVEVRIRFRFAHAVEILHVDNLRKYEQLNPTLSDLDEILFVI